MFVLITTPCSADSFTQAQVDTMTSFTGFCSSICNQNSVSPSPIWVTSETNTRAIETSLNRGTWDLVDQYAFPQVDPAENQCQVKDMVKLINDETLWEQFLRRAGLNPMAAQIVIGAMRRPDLAEASLDQSWGLRRFVQLHPEERSTMFGETLGMRTVERVNQVLDKNWG